MAVLRTRMLNLMSRLKWNGIDNWEELDPRVQGAYIPAAQTWLLQRIKYLPTTPERDGLNPRTAVEDYFINQSATRGWRQHEVKEMGVTALQTLYEWEKDHGE